MTAHRGKENAATHSKKAPSAYSALHLPGTGTDRAPRFAMGSRWQEATGSDPSCESDSWEMCWVTLWKIELNAMLIDWEDGLKTVTCDMIKMSVGRFTWN